VSANGKLLEKPSQLIADDSIIKIVRDEVEFVSRGGKKLAEALNKFKIDVNGLTALDIGASTGGFTDCLLKNGAKKVYAVDVGINQLDLSLKNDKRVENREKINARMLKSTDFSEKIDIIVTDVSFISQTLLYPAIAAILSENGMFVSLVKPQFELSKNRLGKNGIVKDKDGKLFEQIKNKITQKSAENNLKIMAVIPSPITGGDGNKEYLAMFVKHI
ncbi:MAG: TlyA family RNA methyltransferase, partial [Clostridia bacterium]